MYIHFSNQIPIKSRIEINIYNLKKILNSVQFYRIEKEF